MAGYLFTYKIDRAIQYMKEKRKTKTHYTPAVEVRMAWCH
jgi:hypothetical protein